MMKAAIFFFLLTLTACHAFVTSSSRVATTSTGLCMAPRYDPVEQRWSPSSEEESAAAGYPLINSLLRHGPKAFLTRALQPDKYDQAVLKFMASDKVGRQEAMGNMDRFFENAQDWAFERFEMQRTGKKMDYVTLDKKQVILSTLWAGVVVWYGNYFYVNFVVGGGFEYAPKVL